MTKKTSILLTVALIVASSLAITSCGSAKNTATVNRTTKVDKGHNRHDDSHSFKTPKSLHPQTDALMTETKRWLGTPYKYGGESKRGVDCSGLVMSIYKNALDIKLPRNSAQQSRFCSPLDKNQLLPGDLLFFATSGKSKGVSHVGIYVGDGKMVHSSGSSGVIVSNIFDDYYVRTFAGAGYVEKYRAMISEKPGKTKVSETPSDETPFSYRQVDSLPQKKSTELDKKEKSTSTPPPVSQPDKPIKPGKPVKHDKHDKPAKPVKPAVKAVKPDSIKAEPTTDEARNAVLNSLIEQKIDSIFKP